MLGSRGHSRTVGTMAMAGDGSALMCAACIKNSEYMHIACRANAAIRRTSQAYAAYLLVSHASDGHGIQRIAERTVIAESTTATSERSSQKARQPQANGHRRKYDSHKRTVIAESTTATSERSSRKVRQPQPNGCSAGMTSCGRIPSGGCQSVPSGIFLICSVFILSFTAYAYGSR